MGLGVTEENLTQANEIPGWVRPAAAAAALAGAIGAIIGLFVVHNREAWWMLLVNFLFWGGVAHGAFVWSTITRTCQATWAAGFNALAQTSLGFFPFTLILFFLLWIGCGNWVTWIEHPVPEKAFWLNASFFFTRNAVGLITFTALSYLYVAWYRQGESAVGIQAERIQGRINKLAIIIILVYISVYSLVAFDMVMSLEPHWYSTLFGAYFFIGNLYASMAALIILAALLRGPLGLANYLGPMRFSDMGNLLMGFGLFFAGLMFAQWLTIWYGNLPEEVPYVVSRIYVWPWRGLALFLVAGCYLGPFLLLQSEAAKKSPRRLSIIALIVLVSMWFERYILVAPVFSKGSLPALFNPFAWAILLMCLGVFTLVVTSPRYEPRAASLDLALKTD